MRLNVRAMLGALALGFALPPTPAAALQGDTVLTVNAYLDFETVVDPQISPDGRQIIYTRRWVNVQQDRWETALWIMDADGGRQRFLTKGGGARWSPDGTRILFTSEGEPRGAQLFVRWMDAEGAISQITRMEEAPRNPAWTPDGKRIVFGGFVAAPTRWNIAMPTPPSDARWTEAPRVVEDLHYRQDGEGFTRRGFVHLFVVPAEGGTPRQITSGEWNVGGRFAAAVNFDVTPDGRSIVFDGWKGNFDTFYRKSHLYVVGIDGGEVRQITQTDGNWTNPRVSPDGRTIAFVGYPTANHSYSQPDLHIIGLDGGGMRNLTDALDRLVGDLAWASDNSGIYTAVTHHGTRNVRFVPLTGAIRDVTTGDHGLGLSSASGGAQPFGVGVRTSGQAPPDVVRFPLRTAGAMTQLTRVNDDLFAGRRLGVQEELWFTSRDGTRVQGWIVKPPDFDPSRKYPLLMEIHGGPFADYTVAFNYNYQAWAARGYVVLFTNPRGSTSYGEAFARGIDFAYPSVDHDDLMAGVDATIAKGIVDTTRMYIGGCSGGGVLSSWAIGKTNRFAAAAVRCPVTNWMGMFGQTDIPLFAQSFFRKPFWEDPAPWLATSSIMLAGMVTTPTLLMTGELDRRTPMAQTEEYYAVLKYRGIPARLLRFNGEYHGTGSRPSNAMRTILYMDSWYSQWARRNGQAVAR